MKYFSLIFCSLSILTVAACGTDSSPGAVGQQEALPLVHDNDVNISVNGVPQQFPDGSSPKPTLTLLLTDAPLDDVIKVVINLVSVELLSDDASKSVLFTFNTPKQIDLLTLQGVNTETLLSEIPIEAEIYSEIRLVVDDSFPQSFIELSDGSMHEIKVPSGSSSGLKVKGDINALQTRSLSYTIDFDVLKSVVQAGNSGKYQLKPVLRLIDNSTSGHIRGVVDPLLLTAPHCSDSDANTHNAVYVFEGAGVTPSDINVNEVDGLDPVTTASIDFDTNSGNYVFEAAFLAAGDYTLAFTCNVDLENPETEQDLLFFNIQNVTVQINNILFL